MDCTRLQRDLVSCEHGESVRRRKGSSMKGRKPKPAVLHELHGNPGKRKRKDGLAVTGNAPTPPPYLTAHAKRLWKEILSNFGDINLVTPADKYSFAQLCQALARVVEGERILSAEGLIVREPIVNRHGTVTDKEKIKAHPAIAIVKMYGSQVAQIGARFGLSPADRARIVQPQQPADDDDEPEDWA
jgi:P27 family predicted phage terminase small subunit